MSKRCDPLGSPTCSFSFIISIDNSSVRMDNYTIRCMTQHIIRETLPMSRVLESLFCDFAGYGSYLPRLQRVSGRDTPWDTPWDTPRDTPGTALGHCVDMQPLTPLPRHERTPAVRPMVSVIFVMPSKPGSSWTLRVTVVSITSKASADPNSVVTTLFVRSFASEPCPTG